MTAEYRPTVAWRRTEPRWLLAEVVQGLLGVSSSVNCSAFCAQTANSFSTQRHQ